MATLYCCDPPCGLNCGYLPTCVKLPVVADMMCFVVCISVGLLAPTDVFVRSVFLHILFVLSIRRIARFSKINVVLSIDS